MDSRYKGLLKNTVWTLAGNTGSKIIGFLLLPFYTRWLGTSGFGLSDLISTYSNLLIGIITLCLADSIFIFTKNKEEKEIKSFYSSGLIFSAIMFALWSSIFYIYGFLNSNIAISETFSKYHWLILLMVLTTFIQNYTQQFVISLNKIKIFSITGLILCICIFLYSCLLIPRLGVVGYVYAAIFANLTTSLYSFVASKSYKYIAPSEYSWNKIKLLLKYSIPLIPNAIMWWLVSALNRPLMEEHLGLSEIGIYAVANRFPGIVTMVFSVFTVSWNISVFEEFNKPTYPSFYSKVFKMVFYFLTILSLLLMISAPFIIKIFAAHEFYVAWKYMNILIIGSVFSCISSFIGTNFGVVKESKYFFYSSIWGAAISVLLNSLLIPTLGLYGACISIVCSYIAMSLSRFYYSRKYVESPILNEIILIFVILLLPALSVYIFDNYTILLCISISLIMIICFIGKIHITPLLREIAIKFKSK